MFVLTRIVSEAQGYGCVQIIALDIGVLLYMDFSFVKNGNFI